MFAFTFLELPFYADTFDELKMKIKSEKLKLIKS